MPKIKDKDGLTYVCDDCKHEFKADKIRLAKKHKNMSIFGLSVMFVDKDKRPSRGNFDDLISTDRLLACPKCKKVHLHGFDVKGK